MSSSDQNATATAVAPRLSVRNLRVTVGPLASDLPLLDDISFDIRPGEVLGVVGESGAGKSVTGAAIINLLGNPLAITGGEILLAGQRIDNLPAKAMQKLRGARVGYIFQDPMTSLNPVISLGKQLVDTIRRHKPLSAQAARKLALDWIARVGLPNPERVFAAYAHEISGGQRQRIVIALALCSSPELIIADEPTTALDVSVQAQVLSLLRELQQESGAAMMLITHDLGVIAKMADRVAVVYAGRLWEIGPAHALLTQPRYPYTAALIAATPAFDAEGNMQVRPIAGVVPSLAARGLGCSFASRCARALQQCSHELPLMRTEGQNHSYACHAPLPKEAAHV